MRFLPGLELCRRFHEAVVGPILAEHLPDLPYAAARRVADCSPDGWSGT